MPLNLEKLRILIPAGDRSRIAWKAGIPQPSLARLLSGRQHDVKLSTIEKLSAAIGCKARDLIG